jgi:hypothetical protein
MFRICDFPVPGKSQILIGCLKQFLTFGFYAKTYNGIYQIQGTRDEVLKVFISNTRLFYPKRDNSYLTAAILSRIL